MSKPGSGRKRQNPAWRYFNYDDSKGVSICQVDGCGVEIRGKNATNIKNHLRRKHAEAADSLGETLDDTQSRDSSHDSNFQSALEAVGSIKRECDHESREETEKDVGFVTFLITSGLPSTLVEDKGLKRFLEIIGASYELPKKRKTDYVLDDIVERVTDAIKGDIASARSLVLAARRWPSGDPESSILAVSAAFYSRNTRSAVNVLLNVFKEPGPCTNAALDSDFMQCIGNWGIDVKKIAVVMTDSSIATTPDRREGDEDEPSGFVDRRGLRLLEREGIKWLPSLTQFLGLAFTDILRLPSSKDIVEKVRAVVNSVTKSPVLNEELRKAGEREIYLDGPSVGSTYGMITRLLELRTPLEMVLSMNKEESMTLEQWTRLEELKSVLEPFKDSIDNLESENSSLSMVIPTLLEVFVKLRKLTQTEFVTGAIGVARNRCSQFLDTSHPNFNPIPGAASLLDPTVSQFMHRQEVHEVLEAAIRHIKATVSKPCKEGEVVRGQTKKPVKMFRVLHEDTPMIVSSFFTENGIDQELKSYMKSALSYEGDEGAAFWGEQGLSYPLLNPLAEDLLTVPASQACMERSFETCASLAVGHPSECRMVVLEKRTLLKTCYRYYLE